MRRKLAIVLGVITVAGTVHARIGESFERCNVRYGEPIQAEFEDEANLKGVVTYHKNDLIVMVHFNHGKANVIRYSPGKLHSIDYDTAVYLKNLNGRDKKWDLLTKLEVKIYREDDPRQYAEVRKVDPVRWESKDGLMHASYSPGAGTLEVRVANLQDDLVAGL